MLSLNDRVWKEFFLRDIFIINSTSSSIDKNKLVRDPGKYPYITRSDINNGINDYVCEQPDYSIDEGNCITVGLDTQTVFYQNHKFYTGQNIQILRNPCLNPAIAKFLVPLVKNVLSIFSWGGNGATLTRLRRSKIILPIDEEGKPDYAFMEQYIREREQQIIQNYIAYIGNNYKNGGVIIPLNEKKWAEYKISDIFEISPGKRLTKGDMVAGDKPFIGATSFNNGITAYVSNTNVSEDSNVLGVNYNGSVVENFYHPYICIFSDDVKRFRLKNVPGNKYVYLFIKVAILQQKSKYTYGYKFNEQRMYKQILLLPSDEQGKPDYEYMAAYAERAVNQLKLQYLRKKKAMTV